MPGFDGYTLQGVPFHGEFSAADATTTASTAESARRFTLYAVGSTATLTVNANDQVIITDLYITNSVSAGQVITTYDGADVDRTSGETIAVTRLATVSQAVNMQTPYWCIPGTYPKMIAGTSGQVDATIRGVIKRAV